MAQIRQLAAIMFTDIVGYSAMMGKDEQKAFDFLRKNRELHVPAINAFGGRLIKELGDGIMASFNTASEAVHAAIKIQEGCYALKEFQLRIGIHQGDIVLEENDIFGDAVNIASRIQAIAPAGGIFISESVHQNVANKKGIVSAFVKEEHLKNIADPVRIYEVGTSLIRLEGHATSMVGIKKPTEKSIAVLPFSNMSNDPDQDYFSDGISEEILNSLAHIEDLKVAGRTSSFFFKGKNADLKEIGEKLKVNTILEGSVRKQGNRLRITAQLINVEDGFHIWSEKFDRNTDDIFAIQDEIALAITEKLKLTLLTKDRDQLTKTYTHNAAAYELYLKARFHLHRRGSSILKGLEIAKKAIALDPGYALAYACYSDANCLAAVYGFYSGKQVMNEVKQANEKAIALDDSLGEVFHALANYYVCFERNWEESRKNFLKAIELNPKFVQSRSLYGMIYLGWVEGKFAEAEEQIRTSIKLDPLSAIDHADLAWTLLFAGKFEEALSTAQTGIELDNNSFLSHRVAGLCYLALNRFEEAITAFTLLSNLSDRHQQAINGLIWSYCSKDDPGPARLLMKELELRPSTKTIGTTDYALSAAYLGETDTAVTLLEKAFADNDPQIVSVKYAPYVPAIFRTDPRFQNLLDKIGYP